MNTINLTTYAEAMAVAICWIACFRRHGPAHRIKHSVVWEWEGKLLGDTESIRTFHDAGQCGWCPYPQEDKLAAVKAFQARRDTADKETIWFSSSRPVRRRALRYAQGYESEP